MIGSLMDSMITGWGPIFYSLLFLGLSIYWYLTRNFDFFDKKGVPFKKPLFFYGNLKDRLRFKVSFHELHQEFYFAFKGSPYYGIFEGTSPSLMLSDPNLIKNVLVRDFDYFIDRPQTRFKPLSPYVYKILLFLKGKEWKQVRSAVTPAFSSGRLKAMVDIENVCGNHLTEYISGKIEENGGNTVLDMKNTLGKFTLDIIASTAFGVEPTSSRDPNSEMSKKIAKFDDISTFTRFMILATIFLDLPNFITSRIPVSFFNIETLTYLSDIIKEVSLKRKDPKFRRNDFLQLLIDAQTAPLTEDSTSTSPSTESKSEKDFLLSEEIAIAQAIIFFIAGYETSSTVLTMLCYELAKDPSIQEKVRNEILHKLKDTNGQITYELINDLPYLDMTISETLRMYPPVARIDRVCVKKYKLKDIEINPGDKVGVSIYGLHTDPEYYPEPNLFLPERFSQNDKEQRHPFVYLPFGAGPRNCIGLRAAQVAMKICMIHLMKDFKLEKCSETKIPFEFHKLSMILKAKDGVCLQISKLNN